MDRIRPADLQKQKGIINKTKQRVDQLAKSAHVLSSDDTGIKSGLAIVQNVLAYGNGCLCDVEVIVNGNSTGVHYYDAVCHDSLLGVGDIVFFNRNSNDTIDLIAGSGGDGGTTETNTTVYDVHSHQNIYSGGIAGFLAGD